MKKSDEIAYGFSILAVIFWVICWAAADDGTETAYGIIGVMVFFVSCCVIIERWYRWIADKFRVAPKKKKIEFGRRYIDGVFLDFRENGDKYVRVGYEWINVDEYEEDEEKDS